MLKAVQLETLHDEPDAVAFYAYVDGEYDADEVRRALEDDEDERVQGGALSPGPTLPKGKEVPNALSRATGLRRFLAAYAE